MALETVRHFTSKAQTPDTDFTMLVADEVISPSGKGASIIVDSLVVTNTQGSEQQITILHVEANFGTVVLKTTASSIYRAYPVAANTTIIIDFEQGLAMNGDGSYIAIGSSTVNAFTVTASCREVIFNDDK